MKRILIFGFVLLSLGAGVYFLVKHLNKKETTQEETEEAEAEQTNKVDTDKVIGENENVNDVSYSEVETIR